MAAGSGWTVDTLYQHFDERFDALERSLDRRFQNISDTMTRDGATRDAAVREARNVIEGRLQGLNELRREVTEDRGMLVTRQLFDAHIAASDLRFGAIEQWRNRAIGVITVLLIASSTLGAFVGWVLAK